MLLERANPNDRYIWQDLETTGLDDEQDSIIQVAAIVTDGELRELGQFDTLVAPRPLSLVKMNDFVRNMHTENGLLEALRKGNPPSVHTAGNDFRDWISSHKVGDGNLYLAGNSIHAVDIPFTRKYMPQIHMDTGGPLHYRALDVTSHRLGLRLWTGYDFHFQKDGMHNAISDVRQCIDEFKFFRKCAEDFFLGRLPKSSV